MSESGTTSVAAVEATLTEAVRACLGLPVDERPLYVANYLFAKLEGREAPPAPPRDMSNASTVHAEMPPLAAVLSKAVNDAIKTPSTEPLRIIAESIQASVQAATAPPAAVEAPPAAEPPTAAPEPAATAPDPPAPAPEPPAAAEPAAAPEPSAPAEPPASTDATPAAAVEPPAAAGDAAPAPTDSEAAPASTDVLTAFADAFVAEFAPATAPAVAEPATAPVAAPAAEPAAVEELVAEPATAPVAAPAAEPAAAPATAPAAEPAAAPAAAPASEPAAAPACCSARSEPAAAPAAEDVEVAIPVDVDVGEGGLMWTCKCKSVNIILKGPPLYDMDDHNPDLLPIASYVDHKSDGKSPADAGISCLSATGMGVAKTFYMLEDVEVRHLPASPQPLLPTVSLHLPHIP